MRAQLVRCSSLPDVDSFDYARGGPQFGAADLIIGAPLSPVMGGFAGPDTMVRASQPFGYAAQSYCLSLFDVPTCMQDDTDN